MTEKTFFRWVNRYAAAKVELSWIGSVESKEDRAALRDYWTREKEKARQHIKKALDELVS